MQAERQGDLLVIKPTGKLSSVEATALYKELKRVLGDGTGLGVTLDFERVEGFDSSVIAVISLAVEAFEKEGRTLHVEDISKPQREALALMPAMHDGFGAPPPRESALQVLGAWGMRSGVDFLLYLRFCARIGLETFRIVFMGKRYAKGELGGQCVAVGVNAFPIIALSSILIGLVLGFQAAAQMAEFGGIEYVANLVGVGMAREFGPLMAAIVLAGRSGSAMAAELGTMQVQEELDALRVMGLDPERYLVVPRMFAILLMGPSLTLLAIMLGMLGGLVIGVFYVDMTVLFYLHRTIGAVDALDIWHGIWKSIVFSFLIGSISCYCGMQIEGGASGVGKATTKAVVMGIFMIIFADSIATGLSTMFAGVM
jgi:phospholipid/cholesterol/gamma-HCH transport system permease protein